MLEGDGPKETVLNWQKHFTKLLGQPPNISDKDIVISNRHGPLDISTDPFTREELTTAEKLITEGKAYGDDSIAPEV